MAVDNTPPRLKLIATIAIITVVTLISLDFVFKSYYGMMTDEAKREKVAPTTDKDEQHKAEAVALTGASVPIDQAIAQLAKGDRPEAITPNPSEDMAPMTGWSKLPKFAPTAHAMEPAPTTPAGDAGATATGVDGGAIALASDAGAAPAPSVPAPAPNAADAGARPRAPLGRPRDPKPTQPVPEPPAPHD